MFNLHLIMLSITIINVTLISATTMLPLLIIYQHIFDVKATIIVGDFIRVHRLENCTMVQLEREKDSILNPLRRSYTDRHNVDYEKRYRLRYRPAAAKPRLFWHKFPHKQQEEPAAETTSTVTTSTMTTDVPETTTLASMITTEDTSMMMSSTTTTTVAPYTMMPPIIVKPSNRPFTTVTTIMKPSIFLKPSVGGKLSSFFASFGSPLEANIIQRNKNVLRNKSKGFLSLFEVIKIENNACHVAMSDVRTMEGICYHEFECKNLGGISTERCGDGLGVCCICCGDTTNQAIAYFESPNYPNAVREMIICVLVVQLRKNVQQLRLDFLMFELNRPTDGDCIDDQFIISGQNLNFFVPVLCGINTGQHIYVHVGESFENKIYLSFFAKVPTGGRSFNIKITQLENDLAPDGCLQYYKEPEGIVKSFNYDIDGTIVENREATYLNNLNYAICMRRAKETCSITYTIDQGGSDQLDFQIANKDDDENDLVPDGQAGAGIFNCPDDYIAINQVRLCGERFNDGIDNQDFTVNAPVRDNAAGPIILPFRTDSEYVGRGFRLNYKQELCI